MPVTVPSKLQSQSTAFDSYDDDLIWIMDRLVARTGAAWGALLRVLPDGMSLLAASTDASRTCIEALLSPQFAGELRARADRCSLRHVSPPIHQNSAILDTEAERLLWMQFHPTQDLSVLAVLCHGDRSSAFDAGQLRVAATLYPVLDRYSRLWWLHRCERHRAAALATALNLSEVGVLLLTQNAELTFANTRASAILDEHDGLLRKGRCVTAADVRDSLRLQAMIQRISQPGLNSERSSSTPPLFALRRRESRRPLIATVSSVDHRVVNLGDPAVVMYLVDPERNVESVLAAVCALFEFTTSETRLVQLLLQGCTLTEAADSLGLQIESVRGYLRQIFVKTRTHRQAELIRLLLLSLAPVGG